LRWIVIWLPPFIIVVALASRSYGRIHVDDHARLHRRGGAREKGCGNMQAAIRGQVAHWPDVRAPQCRWRETYGCQHHAGEDSLPTHGTVRTVSDPPVPEHTQGAFWGQLRDPLDELRLLAVRRIVLKAPRPCESPGDQLASRLAYFARSMASTGQLRGAIAPQDTRRHQSICGLP
jgi:hypothetical protein